MQVVILFVVDSRFLSRSIILAPFPSAFTTKTAVYSILGASRTVIDLLRLVVYEILPY